MNPRKNRDDHPLLHTMEEATALLRRCPVSAWFWWFAGTAPLVCLTLHFWSDMSRAADARAHLVSSALYLALAYGFMKVAHAVFGDELTRLLRGDHEPKALPLRGKVRVVASQLMIHCTTPWGLVLASAALLPLGWVYAFYHNANILAIPVFREGGRTRDLVKQALTQCHYRPGQNHGVMTILLLFSLLVWMNLALGSYMAIVLMKAFTGSENAFTRNPWLFLSPGFVAATGSVSYMIVGPFVKACYAVRCFYGMSRKNGEDILVRFRAVAPPAHAMMMLLAGVLLIATPLSADPSTPPKAASPEAPRMVDASALDHNIREVMQQDAFQWRMPRDDAHANEDAGWLVSFVRDTGRWLKSVADDVGSFLKGLMKDRLKDWLRKLFGERGSHEDGTGGTPWANAVQPVLYGLLALLAVILVVLLVRQWKSMPKTVTAAPKGVPEIDLQSDQVVATLLAEDEWLRLAQEKMDAGEHRLALRALYLATLAHLGERRMIAIGKSKSNGDYVRELALRARDREELRNSFHDQSREFDRAWYGWHDVTRDLLEKFRFNHQRIVSDGPR